MTPLLGLRGLKVKNLLLPHLLERTWPLMSNKKKPRAQYDNINQNKSFSEAISKQFAFLAWSDVFSAKYSGTLTSAILLGALYLIWCDVNIKTESIPVLILVLIYAYYLKCMVINFCQSIEGILHGKSCLDKLKVCIGLFLKFYDVLKIFVFSTPALYQLHNLLKPNQEVMSSYLCMKWNSNGKDQMYYLHLKQKMN